MDNIYFKPTEENGEFLEKLEGLDEYSVPQILDRMVEYFRTVELKDALIKLSIKTDSLEEELDDDIRVEQRSYVGGKPKKLRHFKGDNPTPILHKEWYKNGQLEMESYNYDAENDKKNNELCAEWRWYLSSGQMYREHKNFKNNSLLTEDRYWWSNGQLSCIRIRPNEHYYDKDGNEIDRQEWEKNYKEDIS